MYYTGILLLPKVYLQRTKVFINKLSYLHWLCVISPPLLACLQLTEFSLSFLEDSTSLPLQ